MNGRKSFSWARLKGMKTDRSALSMRRGRRTWAISYAFVLALLIIVLFGWLIIPPLLKSIGSFFTNLVNIINGLVNNTDQLISYLNLNPIGIQVDSATIQKAFADMDELIVSEERNEWN